METNNSKEAFYKATRETYYKIKRETYNKTTPENADTLYLDNKQFYFKFLAQWGDHNQNVTRIGPHECLGDHNQIVTMSPTWWIGPHKCLVSPLLFDCVAEDGYNSVDKNGCETEEYCEVNRITKEDWLRHFTILNENGEHIYNPNCGPYPFE